MVTARTLRLVSGRVDAGRVQAGTALDNQPMRRVFTKLGFTEEGIMRAFMPSEAGRDDYVLYATLGVGFVF